MSEFRQMKSRRIVKPIARPDWIDSAIEDTIKTLKLASDGKIPGSIKGWLLHTSCMRVLRAIHGGTQATIDAIQDGLREQVELEVDWFKHMQTCKGCEVCDEPLPTTPGGSNG